WSIGGGPANAEQVERMKNVSGAIMWGTGLQDRLGNIAVNSVARAAALREAGVDIVEHNVPGGHTWHSWRPLLNFFVREVIFHDPDDRSGIPLKATVSETTGALTLTVASYGDAVELGDESRLADRLTFRGALPTLTVTDSRSDEQAGGGGWSLTGQSGVFRNGSHELGAGHLGWTPRRAAAKPGVTPGAPVASALSDGRGPAAPAALATADQTGRRGQAAVTADLLLEFPVAAPDRLTAAVSGSAHAGCHGPPTPSPSRRRPHMQRPEPPVRGLGPLPACYDADERRRWDLNPRTGCPVTALAGPRTRPDYATSPRSSPG